MPKNEKNRKKIPAKKKSAKKKIPAKKKSAKKKIPAKKKDKSLLIGGVEYSAIEMENPLQAWERGEEIECAEDESE